MMRKNFLEFTEQIFTVICLLIFSGGILSLVLFNDLDVQPVSPSNYGLMQSIFRLIYLITFLLLIKRWRQVIKLLFQEKFILLLLGLAFVSILWSYAPEFTLRRSISLSGTTLFGIYFATRYTIKQQLQLLGWTFSLAIFLSFLFALIFPEYGIMTGIHIGTWRGIYDHKIHLGMIMMLSAMTYFLLAVDARKNRFFFWFGFGLSLVLIVFSTSKSALINAIIIFGALGIYWLRQQRYALIIPSLIAVVVTGGSLFLQITANLYVPIVLSDNIPALLDLNSTQSGTTLIPKAPLVPRKPDLPTLNGRLQIWPAGLKMIKKHPWLGYGYRSFWFGSEGPSAELWRLVKFKPAHLHNGFLELWLDLGLLGILIFFLGFFSSLRRLLTIIRPKLTSESLWLLLCTIYIILINLPESELLRHNNLFWLLYVATVLSILKQSQLREEDIKRSSPSQAEATD